MTLRNLARHAINQWLNWRARRAIHRAYPDIADLDRKHRPVIKSHRRGSSELYRRKREVMNRALGGV
jgi:hypothetical protein